MLRQWDDLPDFMKTDAVRPYWEHLNHKRGQLRVKRAFDVVMSAVMIVILLIPMLIIAIAVKLGSPGPVLYRQVRVTQYGRKFRICKFRTMYGEASRKENGIQVGSAVTVANDSRVTRVGKVLRKYRLDEFPQLFNVLMGDMSFVGTRPEVEKYVKEYRNDWIATLLLPAGITSECSIRYKDEDKVLSSAEDVDDTYVSKVLPDKMKINLYYLHHFSLGNEALTMFRTVAAVAGKDYV